MYFSKIFRSNIDNIKIFDTIVTQTFRGIDVWKLIFRIEIYIETDKLFI